MTHEEQEGAKRHKWYEGWDNTGLSSGPDPHATFEGGEIEGVEMPSLLGLYPSNQSPAVPVKERRGTGMTFNNEFAPRALTETYTAYWDGATQRRKFKRN
jgi:hypothetical protein